MDSDGVYENNEAQRPSGSSALDLGNRIYGFEPVGGWVLLPD